MTITGTVGTETVNFSSANDNTQYTAVAGITLNTLEFDLDASLTPVTSIKNATLEIGRDGDNFINFATNDKVYFNTAAQSDVCIGRWHHGY